MENEETIARERLDIARYPGKWQEAQRMATTHERTGDRGLLPYWERVRQFFLELGGEYELERKND